jgi:hypothetical protein
MARCLQALAIAVPLLALARLSAPQAEPPDTVAGKTFQEVATDVVFKVRKAGKLAEAAKLVLAFGPQEGLDAGRFRIEDPGRELSAAGAFETGKKGKIAFEPDLGELSAFLRLREQCEALTSETDLGVTITKQRVTAKITPSRRTGEWEVRKLELKVAFEAAAVFGRAKPGIYKGKVAGKGSARSKTIFAETWQRSSPGKVFPRKGNGGRLPGLATTWWVNDTYSEFPECGPPPHYAEILSRSGNRLVKLTSLFRDTECADNIWIHTYPKSVPIKPGTHISFKETGVLEDETYKRKWSNYYFDRIRVRVVDKREKQIWYTLQHREIDVLEQGNFIELFPEPDAEGRYTRNLYEDFLRIQTWDPRGAKISHIIFGVDSHGWAELDDLRIFKK